MSSPNQQPVVAKDDPITVSWGRFGLWHTLVDHVSKRGIVYASRNLGERGRTKPRRLYWYPFTGFWSIHKDI